MNIKLITKSHYIGRILFSLDIGGKQLNVYQSSGFSGTGHSGKFLPFSGIEKEQRMNTQLGYIHKELFYDGYWTHHRKNIQQKIYLDFLESLKERLTEPVPSLEEVENELQILLDNNEYEQFIYKIALDFEYNLEPFDFKILETINLKDITFIDFMSNGITKKQTMP